LRGEGVNAARLAAVLALLAGSAVADEAPMTPMLEALAATGPNPALADKLRLYGQFVGSWDLDVDWYPAGAPEWHEKGEWHFAWVLDGRAVQDVWIFPARAQRSAANEPWHFYGSTFRFYDPASDAWHITYFEPTRPFAVRQVGRAVGDDVVQLADEVNGLIRRWRFVEIRASSFRWLGEVSPDKGATWTLELEMRAYRRTAER
jgi:hypothetical protein